MKEVWNKAKKFTVSKNWYWLIHRLFHFDYIIAKVLATCLSCNKATIFKLVKLKQINLGNHGPEIIATRKSKTIVHNEAWIQ